MKKNLTARTVVIVVTILLCVLRHHRLPQVARRRSGEEFPEEHPARARSEGRQPPGSQVQVQDAVKADADQTMERLKEDLKKQNITWDSMDRNDAARRWRTPTRSRSPSRAFPPTQSSAFRSLVTERFPTYVLTARQLHRLLDEAEADRSASISKRTR